MSPLAAYAAEWQYGGQAGETNGTGDMAAAETSPQTAADGPMAGSPPPSAPANNTPMSKVRETLGEPERVMEGVGEPPIVRWQYPGYVVYFERDRVITSVAGRI